MKTSILFTVLSQSFSPTGLIVNSEMLTLYPVLRRNITACEMSSDSKCGLSALAAIAFVSVGSMYPLATPISVSTTPGDKLCNQYFQTHFMAGLSRLTVILTFLLSIMTSSWRICSVSAVTAYFDAG